VSKERTAPEVPGPLCICSGVHEDYVAEAVMMCDAPDMESRNISLLDMLGIAAIFFGVVVNALLLGGVL
jgi:hypothetical protein